MSRNKLLIAAGAAAIAFAAGAANAEIYTAGTVGAYSDYRLRGVSLSEKEGVIQGSLEAGYKFSDALSVFAGAWGSSLGPDDDVFGPLETDLYVGAKGSAGAIGWSVKYLRLVYIDHSDVNFDQYAGEITFPVGPLATAVGVVYDDYSPGDSTYLYANTSYTVPETPFSVRAGIGHEDGAFYDNKVNWNLGASYTFQKLSLNVDYIDTDYDPVIGYTGKDLADSTIVVSLTAGF